MNDFSFYFKIGWEHIINKEALDHIFFCCTGSYLQVKRVAAGFDFDNRIHPY